jgi:hypothetical protein
MKTKILSPDDNINMNPRHATGERTAQASNSLLWYKLPQTLGCCYPLQGANLCRTSDILDMLCSRQQHASIEQDHARCLFKLFPCLKLAACGSQPLDSV